jgi:hypothetical protein
MLINRKAVKQYLHEAGKQLSSESLEAIDNGLRRKLDLAISNAGRFPRIKPIEIDFAFNGTAHLISKRKSR